MQTDVETQPKPKPRGRRKGATRKTKVRKTTRKATGSRQEAKAGKLEKDEPSSVPLYLMFKDMDLGDIFRALCVYMADHTDDMPTLSSIHDAKIDYQKDPVLAWRKMIVILEGLLGQSLRIS